MSLQSLTTAREIPDDLWVKIEEFQKKGADQNFAAAIAGNTTLIELNHQILKDMEATLNAEEQEDAQLRQQYGPKFNRMPSQSVNQQYRQSINDYKNKLAQAQVTDQQILNKYNTNKQGFSLISKSRGDLVAMIPASQSNINVSSNPVVITIQKCLNDLNEISAKKDAIMAEGVAMHENLNAVEDLMKIQQGLAQKDVIFESIKSRFTTHFNQNDECETQRQ